MITKFRSATALAVALAAQGMAQSARADTTPAPTPDFTITGSAAVASQYRFRGISQSDNLPVVQAAITVSHKSGFYISSWGSSATSNHSPVNIGGTEIDVYGGYTKTLGTSGLTLDGGLYGYIYPGAPAGNLWEIYGSLSKAYGPLSAKVGVNYAPSQNVFNFNFSSPTHYNMYKYAELSLAVPNSAVTLHGHLGHTAGGFDYGKPYLDFTVGASYKWKALTFDISAVGTNITTSDAAKGFAAPIQAYALSCGASAAVQAVCAADATGGARYWQRPAKTVAVASVTASF